MPRRTKKKPKYSVDKTTGHARVYLGGRKIMLGRAWTQESRDKYEQVVTDFFRRQAQQELRRDEQLETRLSAEHFRQAEMTPTISELADLVGDWASGYYRKNGEETREAGLVREAMAPMVELFGDDSCDEFGPQRLLKVRDYMVTTPNGKGQLSSRKHINKQIGRIVRAFKWATEQELIDPTIHLALSAVQGLKTGRTSAPDHQPVQPVPDSIVNETLQYLTPVVADMVRIQRLTGCRPEEVRIMRPCDIDRTSYDDVWIYVPDSHKNEHHQRGRHIAIGPQAQAVLEPYLNRSRTKHCFSPRESYLQHVERRRSNSTRNSRAKGTVSEIYGEVYSKDSYWQAIDRVCRANGIPRWSPNQLRHTAATEIRAAHGLEASQAVLGHAKADITQIYAERDLQKAVDVARQQG